MKKEWLTGPGITGTEITGTENDYYVRTCGWSPPGCHPVGCGMILHVKDNKLVSVEGDPEHPITQGRLCIRCLTLPEYVHHPQRILHPMKRVGERGENKWTNISWEEAFDIIVEKTNYFKENYGAQSIIVYGGTGREATLYYPPLAYAVLGTPNCAVPLSGNACYGPRCTATQYSMGIGYPEIDFAGYFPDRFDNPDYELPEYIMIWGKAPLESNADGFFGHTIIDMMQRGSKLIIVDPRVTWLATRADYHLQLRPGTDTALALGLLNVMINEGIYDKKFVEDWCYGFEELQERVQEYPVSKVAEITWIPAELITAAARKFATAKSKTIQWGVATVMAQNGMQIVQSLLYLMAISGILDVPGGITCGKVSSALGAWRYGTTGEIDPELWDIRIGTKEYPASAVAMSIVHPDMTLDVMETEKPYKLRMAWINSTSLFTCINQAPDRWYRAFKKFEFIVCQELFMTPACAALADIVLPVSTFAEHDGIVMPHFGRNSNFIGAINKALTVGECKSDLEVCIELGKRLNPEAWPWKDAKDFFSEQFQSFIGKSFEDIRELGIYQPKYEYRKFEKGLLRADGDPGFETITSKVELFSNMFEAWGDDPLPYYEEPPYSPYSTPDLFKEYPLILTTGARRFTAFHSEHKMVPTLREIDQWPTMEIHPETADQYGIHEGDWVCLENWLGQCVQRAHITNTIDRRVVHAIHAWWYPEEDITEPNMGGTWKSNINRLMPHKHIGKIGLAAPIKSMICKVYKVDGPEWAVHPDAPVNKESK
ncbi:MAG TPA: molybdopterin-dependent oxidoreductase [Syntrophomonas sp.]|nr:molybdopterin-dependent oxidoreductase [Syntrophomonas sp.]